MIHNQKILDGPHTPKIRSGGLPRNIPHSCASFLLELDELITAIEVIPLGELSILELGVFEIVIL